MPRETKAQKNARVGMLLAEYDEKSRALRKLEKDVKALGEQVRETGVGVYGEWTYSHGTPREILDQPAAQALIKELGHEVPKVMTKPPIVIQHVAATSTTRK